MNKKFIAVAIACFSVMLVIVIAVNVFVWHGIDVAARIAPIFEMGAQEGKVYFTDKHNRKLTYCYDTESGKLSRKKEVTAVNIDGTKLITDDYIFVQPAIDLYAIDRKTKEKITILDLKEAKEKDGFSELFGVTGFDVGNIYQYGSKVYFRYKESVRVGEASSENRYYFVSFDMGTRTFEKFDSEISNYLVKENFLYYVKVINSTKFLCCMNLDTTEEALYPFSEQQNASIDRLVDCKTGIAFFSGNVLAEKDKSISYFDINTKQFFSACLIQDSSIEDLREVDVSYCEEQDSVYIRLHRKLKSEEGYKWWLYRLDLSSKELTTVSTELNMPIIYSVGRQFTPMIWVGNKGYFGAYGMEPSSNDSFAFCSVDSSGNVETILYKDISLERKIFGDYVDEKRIVRRGK